ncbi:type II CAAX endopeptidase family protein [uncultured Thermanaerothrix sp.]|uniref:CPBP family intramembrane glutamic endopeptidase n=1 Tax=uncultured Thermanaerothrix sp. TaxID=1195149 RepID=UPI0026376D4D|nr:type II CAAX endopeptidase family protein [uncultured Thermanaerothrix sp.]
MVSSYLSAAREGRHETWRYIATLALVIWLFISVSFGASLVAVILTGTTDLNAFPPLLLLILAMLPFPLGGLLGLVIGLRLFHRRSLLSLINPAGRVRWAFLWRSFGLWLLLCALSDLILWLINPTNYTWAADWSRFLPYALLAILLIPFQTSTEELIFRGYLTQWIGRSRLGFWAALVLPNLIFALLHGLNPEVQTYGAWLTLPLYFGIGLVLSWVTLQSGGLEYALGMHAANNFYAALLVTFPASALPSPALVYMRKYDPVIGLISFIIMASVYLFILSRRSDISIQTTESTHTGRAK